MGMTAKIFDESTEMPGWWKDRKRDGEGMGAGVVVGWREGRTKKGLLNEKAGGWGVERSVKGQSRAGTETGTLPIASEITSAQRHHDWFQSLFMRMGFM